MAHREHVSHKTLFHSKAVKVGTCVLGAHVKGVHFCAENVCVGTALRRALRTE